MLFGRACLNSLWHLFRAVLFLGTEPKCHTPCGRAVPAECAGPSSSSLLPSSPSRRLRSAPCHLLYHRPLMTARRNTNTAAGPGGATLGGAHCCTLLIWTQKWAGSRFWIKLSHIYINPAMPSLHFTAIILHDTEQGMKRQPASKSRCTMRALYCIFVFQNTQLIALLKCNLLISWGFHISQLMDGVSRETLAVSCWEINVPAYSITPASSTLLLQAALMYHWDRTGQTSLKTGNAGKQKQGVISHSCSLVLLFCNPPPMLQILTVPYAEAS